MNNKRVFLVLVVSNVLDLLGGKSIGEENKSGAKHVFRLPCFKGISSISQSLFITLRIGAWIIEG